MWLCVPSPGSPSLRVLRSPRRGDRRSDDEPKRPDGDHRGRSRWPSGDHPGRIHLSHDYRAENAEHELEDEPPYPEGEEDDGHEERPPRSLI